MGRRVLYHPSFDCDVREAAIWYDQHSMGLGDAFVDEVRQRVQSVMDDPARFATTDSGCRYVRLKRFPYVVLFDVTDLDLRLLGVLHTARSIVKWRKRLHD